MDLKEYKQAYDGMYAIINFINSSGIPFETWSLILDNIKSQVEIQIRTRENQELSNKIDALKEQAIQETSNEPAETPVNGSDLTSEK